MVVPRLTGVRRALGFNEIGAVHAVLRGEGPGVMVDVGAHFGSSLRPFANDGWQVYALEPDPSNRAVLMRLVSGKPNVVVDGRAVSERDGEIVQLYTSPVSTGISTLAPFHQTHQPSVEVETVRLDTFLATVDEVAVLKTDTEGYDLPVLRSFPWDRIHPRAVVAEFEDRKTLPLGYDFKDMADFMMELGYAVLVSEWYPVVEYGQHHRWRSLRRYPTALTDKGGWGNLICVEPHLAGRVLVQAHLPRRVRAAWRRAAGRLRR